MQLSRAQLDGNLDQLAADLPGLVGNPDRANALATFHERADDILRSTRSEEDRRHAQHRIDAMLREHGLDAGRGAASG
ncbi:hypothetical protein [Dokdonella fugitiva]|jgi:hypothetical protein|uniref:Uncharacterized protein n=1 Tax=Dokdonella fugitiva TaxID=328517 RepID=A0A4R2I9E8_9GAMM|nr:hypothetical protein [Dokdonella fugitiva]MBA8883440.1 hypothetical protein [Dokdonella fugitiva]TCO40757.1 hypothetical protein EV148_104118 [Dokdonella fugitiva]